MMAASRRYESRGQFSASPDALWPLLADTPKLNQALGMPPVEYVVTPVERGGSKIEAMVRIGRWPVLRWTEHPFLWREPYGWVVFREFKGGPFVRVTFGVEQERVGDKTDVLVYAEFEPRNALGAMLLRTGLGQRSTDRILAQCSVFDLYLQGAERDPFPQLLPKGTIPERARLISDGLIVNGQLPSIVEHLYEHLTSAREVDVARMRPFELADHWNEDRRETLAVFLHATVAGLLLLTWDVLCPGCRVGKREVSALRDVQEQAHCDVCNITFDAGFDQLVEVRFSPAPGIRDVTLREFCIGGPMNTPHIAAQVPVQPGERHVSRCKLAPGSYLVRAAAVGQTTVEVAPAVDGVSPTNLVELSLTDDGVMVTSAQATSGEVDLVVTSTLKEPAVVTWMEQRWPDTIATAAIVSTMPEFRDLFSSEVLAPGLQLGVSRLCFMFTDLTGSTALYQRVGQARAFRIVQEQFAILGGVVAEHRGAIVKTIGDAIMATFSDPVDAIAAGLAIQREIRHLDLRGEADPSTLVRVGIHQGPCVAVTLNDRLDYFGTTVNIASRVEHEARGGEVAATAEICESPEVQNLLAERRPRIETALVRLRGIDEPVRIYRLSPALVDQPVGAVPAGG
jgi:class 3 adenylate cyclase